MKDLYSTLRPSVLLVVAGVIGATLLFTNVGCPPDGIVPPTCTTAADCDNGLFCDGAETCVNGACVDGTAPCPAEECDEEADECVEDIPDEVYAGVLDEFFEHDLAAGGHFNQACDACHHSEPSAAGRACPDCHDRDEALFNDEYGVVVPKLKDAMHAPALEDRQGCRGCHDDETDDGSWDCSQCHLTLDEF